MHDIDVLIVEDEARLAEIHAEFIRKNLRFRAVNIAPTLADARKMAKEIDGHTVTLRVNPQVAKALKSREGALLSELESLTKKDVIVKSDAAVHQERFEIF